MMSPIENNNKYPPTAITTIAAVGKLSSFDLTEGI